MVKTVKKRYMVFLLDKTTKAFKLPVFREYFFKLKGERVS